MATVTSDSLYIYDLEPGYSNCLSGLVDGIFSPKGISPSIKCCAHTYPLIASTWLNIDMGMTTVVWTVFIINREEECCINRIIGSDLFVGFSSLPQ